MRFGFSYVGLIFLVMLMVPNILWTRNQPKDHEKYAVRENKILLFFERIGEASVTCIALIFSDFNVGRLSLWSLWLLAAVLGIGHIGIHWQHKKETRAAL